ncbi:MAG: hypothetical protein ACOC3T_05775 [Bacteroidota bacterium]
MKKIILISSGILIIAAINAVLLFSLQEQGKKDMIREKINGLENTYDNSVFRAFYSLPELRPFSIIQLDETYKMYDQEWISPEKYVSKLNENSKDKLKDRVASMLSERNEIETPAILEKLEAWCKADKQLYILHEYMGFEKVFLVNAMRNIELTKNIGIEQNAADKTPESMTGQNVDEAFYDGINRIANLETKSQLGYYSGLFLQLSALAYK